MIVGRSCSWMSVRRVNWEAGASNLSCLSPDYTRSAPSSTQGCAWQRLCHHFVNAYVVCGHTWASNWFVFVCSCCLQFADKFGRHFYCFLLPFPVKAKLKQGEQWTNYFAHSTDQTVCVEMSPLGCHKGSRYRLRVNDNGTNRLLFFFSLLHWAKTEHFCRKLQTEG